MQFELWGAQQFDRNGSDRSVDGRVSGSSLKPVLLQKVFGQIAKIKVHYRGIQGHLKSANFVSDCRPSNHLELI